MAVPSDQDLILALGEDLPVGLWVARVPGGEVFYANRAFAALTGQPAREDVTAAKFAAHYGVVTRRGTLYPEGRMPFARAVAERCTVIADDMMIRRHDGTTVEVRAVARPVGEPTSHVVVALFDVSREVAAERARAECEQQLRRAQRFEAIGSLAAGTAHEFNNLMFGVKLLAAELAASEPDPKRRAALEMIDDITERSAALTRSLLGFVRRGKQRSVMVSINDIATSMAELLGRAMAGVELTFELDAADRGAVVGDQPQLEQLIMDLALHACDAVGGAGRIVIRTSDAAIDTARAIALEVIDDGAGLTPERRARLFEPDAPASEDAPGSRGARGLASVRAIALAHGGAIEIGNGLDGRGTAIRVLLPAADQPRTPRPRIAPAELPRGSGLILVVDDDHMVRKVVTGSLGALGYTTIEALSGSDAIEIYRAQHDQIRAVVLDMVMPDMAGKATYLALRAIDSNVAVLLMSGHTMNEQVQEILDLGVRRFVSKPYSIGALATALAELTQ
ncbi:MAG TPA: response regulator [Kofleriaceae bacterium]|nr:response regulator [Kofleriaceae bacterium]